VSGVFRCFANCVTLISGLSVIRTGYAQDTIPLLVRVEDRARVGPRNRVVVRDPRTGLDHEVYRSNGHIPFQVEVSLDGRYVSFIEVVSQKGAGKLRLSVIERSGRIAGLLGGSSIYAPRGVRQYVWCCGPDTVAIVTGSLSDEGEGGTGESTTLPQGFSLVDVRTGGALPIPGLRFPLQIHWAAFDSSLYIKDSPDAAPGARGPTEYPVYRYHVPTRVLSRTPHRGIFFSPDGKYYFDTGVSEGWGSFQLYRADNDQEVTAQLSIPRYHLGPEGGWLPGAGHTLVFIEKAPPRPPRPGVRGMPQLMPRGTPQVYPDRWNLMVDAGTGKLVERFQGDIGAGWRTNGKGLPVEQRGGVKIVRPGNP
jgi:hypothetical protein